MAMNDAIKRRMGKGQDNPNKGTLPSQANARAFAATGKTPREATANPIGTPLDTAPDLSQELGGRPDAFNPNRPTAFPGGGQALGGNFPLDFPAGGGAPDLGNPAGGMPATMPPGLGGQMPSQANPLVEEIMKRILSRGQ